MNTHEDEQLSVPSPWSITTMVPPFPALTLEKLSKNVIHTLEGSPNLLEDALELLRKAITPFGHGTPLHEIFYWPAQGLSPSTPTANQNTLKSIFESIVFNNTPLTTYTQDCEFYHRSNGTLHKFHDDFQHSVKKALFELQGIQFYLNCVEKFWSAQHEAYPYTNKEYMARSMAAQLQCASMTKKEDHSLNLESVDLILRFAHLNITPIAYAFRVSLTPSIDADEMPLTGVFLITKKPEETVDSSNPCVLYIPDGKLQQFESIAIMKTYLATYLLNPAAPNNPLPNCIALRQHSVLEDLINRRLLDVQNITLSPIPIDRYFFGDHVQTLIDKHKQDLTYNWSKTHRPAITTTHLDEVQFRFKLNYAPFIFFGDTWQNHAIPALTAWQQSQLPVAVPAPEPEPEGELEQPPTSLKPIKLHIILHKDLEPSALTTLSDTFVSWHLIPHMSIWSKIPYTFPSIKEKYLSWLVTEIESLSNRKVEIIEINKEAAPELYNFKYISNTAQEASNRWQTAVTQYLQRTSQTTTELDKFMLLTRRPPAPQVAGFANTMRGQFAVSSLVQSTTPAHELGHMLGAEHEKGEVIYNGWWSETLMYSDDFSRLRTDTYRFSDENRALIKSYLSQFD